MIERYSLPKMSGIWTDKFKYNLWLKVELAVCEAAAKHGHVPKKSFNNIKAKAGFDIERINDIEKEVRHDVIAFLEAVSEKVDEDARYIHMGMTSSDLVDTAFALQLVEAGNLINEDITDFLKILKKRAFEFKDTPMMGRTHGIFAEPVTFGLKLAIWYAEFTRHIARLNKAIEEISVGKISGAVGTYAHLNPDIEKETCKILGLKPETISSQIIGRDRHANFFAVLAGIAASIEKVATEVRLLQQSEIGEVAEPFGRGQRGSSAMPHKRNPVLCENLCGLSRIVRANSIAAFEDVALWHERDISHSSVERIISPDTTILVNFMLSRISDVIEGLDVYPERMKLNIEKSLGLYNSQEVMLTLTRTGMKRGDAYKIVQGIAMKAWNGQKQFYDLLFASNEVIAKINKKQLDEIFDLNNHFKHVDEIFNRVFG